MILLISSGKRWTGLDEAWMVQAHQGPAMGSSLESEVREAAPGKERMPK